MLDQATESQVKNLYKKLVGDCIDNTVMLHIRREDTLVKGNNGYGILKVEYFRQVIDTYFSKKEFKILVFTDDIEWCKMNAFLSSFTIITEKDPVKSLRLMTMCRHFILGNSTFSWWGAILGAKDESTVIYPCPFFAESDPMFIEYMIPNDKNWLSHPSSFVSL